MEYGVWGIVRILNSWLIMSAALMLDISNYEKKLSWDKNKNPWPLKIRTIPHGQGFLLYCSTNDSDMALAM